MSKITLSKFNRIFEEKKIRDKFEITKKSKIDRIQERTKAVVDYSGVKFDVLVSPGQLINKKKAFKREMERRSLELS